MKQKCRFSTQPPTMSYGGFLKGQHIVWLNLCVRGIAPEQGSDERYESQTARLVLSDKSLEAFLAAADSTHVCLAGHKQTEDMLRWFGAEDDINAWAQIRKMQTDGYDRSEAVNSFLLNSHRVWFDKATRLGLVRMYEITEGATPSLWHDGIEFPMPSAEVALDILRRVELYAMQCYAATRRTMQDIDALLASADLDGLKTLDIPARYPETPVINYDGKEAEDETD